MALPSGTHRLHGRRIGGFGAIAAQDGPQVSFSPSRSHREGQYGARTAGALDEIGDALPRVRHQLA